MKRYSSVVLVVFLLGGCGHRKTTAELIEQLKDQESAQRLHAIKELEQRSGEASRIVPALAECLKDQDTFVRRDAAEALGSFGTQAKEAVPALMVALRDKTPRVRKAAAESLKKIDPGSAAQAGLR